MNFSEFNFGEYDARQEFIRHPSYFLNTFIDPISFQLSTLNNRKNYIIVGQKGTGKTACQIHLESSKSSKEGYLTGLISFYDDLSSDDYTAFSKTQKINLVDLKQINNLDTMYDFKEVWKRILFVKIACIIKEAGFDNPYVSFCLSTINGSNSILDGIKKGLKIEFKIPILLIESKIKFDFANLAQNNELTLSDFNRIAEQLLVSECKQNRIYFFIDELVLSNVNTRSDEYRARLCLIRDIVRSSNFMNNFCVQNDLDFHFICSLRPEIRSKLNYVDPEISKIMDGNDVFLSWDRDAFYDILTRKIVYGAPHGSEIDAESFIPKHIKFGSHQRDFLAFLIDNSWYKPRDIVRFLKSYAKMNSEAISITEDGTKNCLNEYSRISAAELFDQISVNYSQATIAGVKKSIKNRRYKNAEDLSKILRRNTDVSDVSLLMEQLYTVGIIGNVASVNGKDRFFYSFRQEEDFDEEMGIIVHPGLMNYFNVRHR